MVILEFGVWWYGAGWAQLVRTVGQRMRRLALTFSLPILIRTLFAPWRRIISYGDRSVQERLRATLDNTISRFVGFGVRLVVMLTALLLIALTGVIGLTAIICWPLLPLAGLALVIRGFLPW